MAILLATELVLLGACGAGEEKGPRVVGPVVFLVEPGEQEQLDGNHRISLAQGYRLVSAFEDAPWLFYRLGPDLLANDLSGSPAVRIATTGGDRGSTGTRAWSADGTRLFDFEGEVFMLDLRALRVTELTHLRHGGGRPEWLAGHVFMPVKYYHHDPEHDCLIVLLNRFLKAGVARGEGTEYPEKADTVALGIDLSSGKERVLFTAPTAFRSWAACPARRRLYVSFDDRLEIRNLDGALLKTLRVPGLSTSSLTVSPDGTRLLAEGPYTPGEPDQGFSIHDALDGSRLAAYPEGAEPRWSPDGKGIAFVRNYSDLWLYDCETNVPSPIFAVDTCIAQAHSYGSPPSWSKDGRFLAVHVSASRGGWQHSFYTIVLDMAERKVKVVHEGWLHLAWLPSAVGRFK